MGALGWIFAIIGLLVLASLIYFAIMVFAVKSTVESGIEAIEKSTANNDDVTNENAKTKSD